MKIEVSISAHPIDLHPATPGGCGAVVRFEGIVRDLEDGRQIQGLLYEAYQPMAEDTMIAILRSLAEMYPCEAAFVQHRVGFVPAGEAAIVVEIQSRHRGEAFSLISKFMDRLKVDVPIWKVGSR